MEQGLPVAFENNAQTWQNMPGMAAFYTGRQNQIAQDNIAALQKAFEAEQAYKAQTRPVELQNLIRSGALTEAQARHADALSRLTGLSSDKAKAVMPGEIASTNAKNQTEVVNANQQQHAIQTTRYAAWLEAGGNKMPKFMQAQKFMETFGVDPKHGDEVLQNIPKLVQMIPQEARKLYQLSPTGQDTAAKEAGANSRNASTNATSISVANIHKDATLGAASERAKARAVDFEQQFRKVNALEKLVLLGQEAQIQEAAGNTEAAAQYRKRAQDPTLIKAAQAIAAAGGASTVRMGPNGPEIVPRQEAVDLSPGNKPKQGTPENPIKLD